MPGHAGQRDLVGFLVVGGAGRGPHLAFVFPSGIGAGAKRVFAFDGMRQREKALRHHEGFVDLLLRNAVIDELEESDLGRGFPQLLGNLGLAGLESAHVDARHLARAGPAGR